MFVQRAEKFNAIQELRIKLDDKSSRLEERQAAHGTDAKTVIEIQVLLDSSVASHDRRIACWKQNFIHYLGKKRDRLFKQDRH